MKACLVCPHGMINEQSGEIPKYSYCVGFYSSSFFLFFAFFFLFVLKECPNWSCWIIKLPYVYWIDDWKNWLIHSSQRNQWIYYCRECDRIHPNLSTHELKSSHTCFLACYTHLLQIHKSVPFKLPEIKSCQMWWKYEHLK